MLAAAGSETLTTDPPSRLVPRLRFDHTIGLVTLAPWLVVLLTYVFDGAPPGLEIALVYLGAPHVLATAGLFVEPGLREHVRANRAFYVGIPALTIGAFVLVFTLAPDPVVEAAVVGFLLWQIHHFTKQNLGMFAFWSKVRKGPSATAHERRLIQLTSIIGMAGIIRAAGLGGWVDQVAQAVGIATIVGLAVLAVVAGRHAGPARVVALLVAVAFYAPVHLVVDAGLVFAAFTYNAAHGAQYYLMVGKATRPTRKSGAVALTFVLSLGLLFLLAGDVDPLGASAWVFAVYKGIVATHFIADSRLWRLRDPDIRGFMKTRFGFL